MEELRLILTDTDRQEAIKEASVYNRSLKVYEYSGSGFQASGKTRDLLISNLLKTIRIIIRG
ncbi:hypothetical protein [Dyadobacter sp. CY312]|uniref:hypothetical protein n=1 Tax=Dyadobacter sp. CY312 TaxID=2907303 RepID=UPI001F398011|nr:hypothetical protein [Dyadobacter sp. CY312]MCE7039248.1 hypothetical protein [Dyadobacter sp. CY312]